MLSVHRLGWNYRVLNFLPYCTVYGDLGQIFGTITFTSLTVHLKASRQFYYTTQISGPRFLWLIQYRWKKSTRTSKSFWVHWSLTNSAGRSLVISRWWHSWWGFREVSPSSLAICASGIATLQPFTMRRGTGPQHWLRLGPITWSKSHWWSQRKC